MIPAQVKLINTLGLVISPATEDKQDAVIAALTGSTTSKLKVVLDDVTAANITYIGKAAIGSATSAAVWQVQKIDETGSPVDFVLTTAASGAFTSIWDNRTSLTYA